MEHIFEVAVIGSGSAGTQAALTAQRAGRAVAILDERPYGGTCALRGCDPKKVLVHAARTVEQAQRLCEFGVLEGTPKVSWPQLMRFKRTFTDPVPEQREKTYREAGITALHGRASFADKQTLFVGQDTVHASYILIASGAAEVHVARGDDALLTGETFMELDELPKSLLFVGGGYIAFELAHIAARAGAAVTILHNDAHPLHGFDSDIVGRAVELARAAGIAVQLETPVDAVERDADGVRVHTQTGQIFHAENGVLAAGRRPDLEHLGLDIAGIERTNKGIKVNDFLQSASNPHVYAAGDAADAGTLPLTPVAGYTGEVAAHNIVSGNTRRPDFRGLATMAYTIPPLGSVGLTEAQAREQNLNVEIHAGDMTQWYSTRHVAARGAFYKIVVEKATQKILGATLIGPHAEEQINVLALAIRNSLSASSVADSLFAYPTGSSDLEYLVR